MSEPSSPLVRHIRELARHMAWADATVWSAVLTAQAAANDPKIADTLHHIHLVQHLFVQAWTRAAFAVRERSEFPGLDDIALFGVEGRRGVLAFVEGVTAEELDRELRMPWAAFFEQQSKQAAGVHTLGESMLQVFLHTQHHRGQICMRMRELGVVPPTVDFILWLWSGRPSENLTV
jgi:uncharacterized damage-inducible protein DinB